MSALYSQAVLIFAFGAFGGFTICLLRGSRSFWPRYHRKRIWQPGWSGSVFLGAVAAVVMWGIYGPAASYDVLDAEGPPPRLAVVQLLLALVVGMGGSHFLTLEVQKQILRSQRDEEKSAKNAVADVADLLLEEESEEPHGTGKRKSPPASQGGTH